MLSLDKRISDSKRVSDSDAGDFRVPGVAADFSGSYKQEDGADVHIYTYTFGPVASENVSSNFRIFAHALFGGAHLPTACFISSGSPDECGSAVASGVIC